MGLSFTYLFSVEKWQPEFSNQTQTIHQWQSHLSIFSRKPKQHGRRRQASIIAKHQIRVNGECSFAFESLDSFIVVLHFSCTCLSLSVVLQCFTSMFKYGLVFIWASVLFAFDNFVLSFTIWTLVATLSVYECSLIIYIYIYIYIYVCVCVCVCVSLCKYGYLQSFAKLQHKSRSIGHSVRIEFSINGLLV